ncbi:PQQ-dependent sugar dehydrogenase [Catenulispora yoronensis]|uniref:PQQ-dependent sugar dehydrogenase n=1 Tax=Catenulispora yoronensis TaxID=450799 RepID=UPI0031DDD436
MAAALVAAAGPGAVAEVKAATAVPATPPTGFSDTVVANVTLPVGLGFTPDGRMLVTTKPGQLYAYDKAGKQTLALDASGFTCAGQPGQDERGMLSVTADPSFATNSYIYVYYSHSSGSNCFNRLSRFTLDTTNHVVSGSEKVLLDGIAGDGFHNAGDVVFGKDGDLYVSVGDGHCLEGCDPSNTAAQDLKNLNGKVLRIAKDGSIPAGNPYSGTGTARCNTGAITSGKCQEIYAYGFRNPFRISVDPNASGTRIFVNDVGQNTTEEVDLLKAGADYGWPDCEGPCSPANSKYTDPYYSYADSMGGGRGAIAGGVFVPNGLWNTGYNGEYLFSDYVKTNTYAINATGASGSGLKTFSAGSTAISMKFAPQDLGGTATQQALYYTNLIDGTVHKVTSGATTPTASFTTNGVTGATGYCSTKATTAGAPPFTVSFDGSASADPKGLALTYHWDFGDGATATTTTPTTSHTYTTAGKFTPKLTVTNSAGGSSPAASGAVRTDDAPPALTITSPSPTGTFTVGQTYTPAATAVDSGGAALPASALTWQVWLFHINHVHPVLDPVAGDGATSFVAPPAEQFSAIKGNSRLLVCLSGTDANGVTQTVEQDFDPKLVQVSLNSQPAGLKVNIAEDDVDAGGNVTTPATVTSWAGYQLHLNAPDQTDAGGTQQTFASWSDGGTQAHAVTPTSDSAYTATFTPSTCASAQLLTNPGFESNGTGWTQTSTLNLNPITKATTAEPAHSGSYIADFNGNGSKDTDTVAQTVSIPSGCTASLSYWLHVDSTESTTTAKPDTFKAQVLNAAGTVLGTVGSFSNLDKATGYKQHTADLSAYAGQTVTLKFSGAETDANGGTTSFVLDDTALNTSGGVPVSNDFSLSATPGSASATAGASATSTIGTAVTSGSAQSVALSASGLPTGATASFAPASVTAGGSSTLTVATSATTPAGTYPVTVTGTAASGTHTATFTLTVTAPTTGCANPGQLLANPGFESGATAWTQTSTLGFTPITKATTAEPAHAGSWIADFNGNGSKDTDTEAQQVSVPAGCAATLAYWLHVDSTETTTTAKPDTFTVQVLNSAGTVLATVGSFSNLDKATGYKQHTADLSAYAGQTVTVKFTGSETDTSGGTTSFVIDDTALTTS